MCDTPPLTLKPPTCFLHALHPLQGAGMVMSRMVLKAKLEDGRQSSSLHPRMTVWSREYPFPTSKSYLGLFAGREITLYSIWSATIWGYLYPNYPLLYYTLGFPGGSSDKEPTCQCRKHERRGFNPWVGKIFWRWAQQPTPIFLLGESHGQRSLEGCSP